MWLLLKLCFSAEPEDILVKMPVFYQQDQNMCWDIARHRTFLRCVCMCAWCMHMCVYRRVNTRCRNKGEFIWFVKYLRNCHWSLLNWEVSFLWGINMKLFHFSPSNYCEINLCSTSHPLPTFLLPVKSVWFYNFSVFRLPGHFSTPILHSFQISPFVSQHWLDLGGGSGLSLTTLYSTLSCSLYFPCCVEVRRTKQRRKRTFLFLLNRFYFIEQF